MLRRTIARLFAPFARVLARRASTRDAWERCEYHQVPPTAFGAGNRHDFGWYLEGPSTVQVTSLDDIQDWLLGCEFVEDEELFNETDFWQHPHTFEQLRRGDCEDHALWAWRKLVELGHDADLVSGTVVRGGTDMPERGGHVWVMLRQEGQIFVFEAVAKAKPRMLRPLPEVRDHYRPEFGVDRARQRYAFNGALIAFNEQQGNVRRSGRRSA
jgi:hypothetical protein